MVAGLQEQTELVPAVTAADQLLGPPRALYLASSAAQSPALSVPDTVPLLEHEDAPRACLRADAVSCGE